MRMYELIEKKRDGKELTAEEIAYVIDGYVDGSILDYQMAAMLMAIFLKGMSERELTAMTNRMANSGDVVDLSELPGVKVDKHSTGGVGDKTTLIACPIAAACGVTIAKMSGRGLGHTGGTVDKLESIPGFQTSVSQETFLNTVKECGISVIGQSGHLAPADKKIYALRDVTATVDSIPLIASSIMSKKLAAGSDGIVLDVKTGSGAFMREFSDALTLARQMIAIGKGAGKKVCALITDMDVPLGYCIGNALEVREAVETLQGNGPKDLTDLCVELAAEMITIAGICKREEASGKAREAIRDGSAFQTLVRMVQLQGGDDSVLYHTEKLAVAPCRMEVKAEKDGTIVHMDTHQCGAAAGMLGAGRATKEEAIDYGAGIVLKKKTGDAVKAGEVIAVFYASRQELLKPAAERFLQSVTIEDVVWEKKPLILARVDQDGILH